MTLKSKIIDGRTLAAQAKQEITRRVQMLIRNGRPVRLDAVLVGQDSAAAVYARNQGKGCDELGIEYVLHEPIRRVSHD